jgi:hypothetical protein
MLLTLAAIGLTWLFVSVPVALLAGRALRVVTADDPMPRTRKPRTF